MKIRWWGLEVKLACIWVTSKIAGFIIDFKALTATDIQIRYANIYNGNLLHFNYLRNLLVPQSASVILLFIAFLLINTFTIPVFLKNNLNRPGLYLVAIFQMLGIAYLVALGMNVASYFSNPSFFNYSGFDLLKFFGYNDKPLGNLFFGLDKSLILITVYTSYALIRADIVRKMADSVPENEHTILVVNRIGSALVVYLALPLIWHAIRLEDAEDYDTIYLTFITPALLTFFANFYWLFPSKGNTFFNLWLIAYIVLFTFFVTLIAFEFFSKIGFNRNWWILSWSIQLFFITPLSWGLFLMSKDKDISIRSAERQ